MDVYISQLLRLSRSERYAIVQALLKSLRDEENSDPALSEAWEAEIERRSNLIDEGSTTLIEKDEALNKIRGK